MIGEANLDLQYVLAVSQPIPILEYSTGGRGPLIPTLNNKFPSTNEPYLEFLTYVLAQDDAALPQTLTTSYGEEEQSVPEEYALKVCNLFMQLGARGVSVLFSSGIGKLLLVGAVKTRNYATDYCLQYMLLAQRCCPRPMA